MSKDMGDRQGRHRHRRRGCCHGAPCRHVVARKRWRGPRSTMSSIRRARMSKPKRRRRRRRKPVEGMSAVAYSRRRRRAAPARRACACACACILARGARLPRARIKGRPIVWAAGVPGKSSRRFVACAWVGILRKRRLGHLHIWRFDHRRQRLLSLWPYLLSYNASGAHVPDIVLSQSIPLPLSALNLFFLPFCIFAGKEKEKFAHHDGTWRLPAYMVEKKWPDLIL